MRFLQNAIDYIERIGLNVARICSVGVILACFTANPAAADPGKGTLFGVSPHPGQLLSIDPSTGIATPIGAGLGFLRAPSLARDPLTGTLYATSHQGNGNPDLYTVDATTGVATLVGVASPVGNSGLGFASITSLDFDSTGVLFAAVNIAGVVGGGADHLATIDTATGTATILGPFGICMGLPSLPIVAPSGSCDIEGMEGIAFDFAGNLWGVLSARGALVSGAMPGLYSINATTGAAAFAGPLLEVVSGDPASGGFVSLQFGSDGRTYLGSARALPLPNTRLDGGRLAIIEPGDSDFTFAPNAATGGSSLSALAFEGGVVIFPPDPFAPVTAVVEEVIEEGTFEQFFGCVIEDDRGAAKVELPLVPRIIAAAANTACQDILDVFAEMGTSPTPTLKTYQRAFQFNDPPNGTTGPLTEKIALVLITSRNTAGELVNLTKGVFISEEDAVKAGLTPEPGCVVADASDSPTTVAVNLLGIEPNGFLARNWTINCNRTRSGGRTTPDLLAFPIRNVKEILPLKAQVNQEAGDFRLAVKAEQEAGCVDAANNGRFLRDMMKDFNKAMRLANKGKFPEATCALNDVTLFALDPDDNDPYGACPNNPGGHLPSRLLALSYQVHRYRGFPDTFKQYKIDPRILCELPTFPGEAAPDCVAPLPLPLPGCPGGPPAP